MSINKREREKFNRYYEENTLWLSKAIFTISWGAIGFLGVNVMKYESNKTLFSLMFLLFVFSAISELFSTYLSRQGSIEALSEESDNSNISYERSGKIETFRNITLALGIISFVFLTFFQLFMSNNSCEITMPPTQKENPTAGLIHPSTERPSVSKDKTPERKG